MAELEPGAIFAGHRIDAVAGSGGMGIVYRATHMALDVTVALKVIAPQYATDPGFRERFQRESRLAASIEHPNVVQVRHAGEEDGLLYITMRFVDGTDLRAMIEERGKVEPKVAADIVAQVGAGLDAAHARGLVHRDVKPANVLIEEGGSAPHAFLTDFGLTRHAVSQAGLTRTGQWVGTLDYVAPEQIEGKPVDARSDVYALGCVLFHSLTGAVPYMRDSDVATMYAHLNDPPPELAENLPGVAPELEEVIKRSMAKKPGERYPSAGDLGRAAVAAAEGEAAVPSERSVATGKAAGETKVPPAETNAPSRPTAAPTGETPIKANPQVTAESPKPAGIPERDATRVSAPVTGKDETGKSGGFPGGTAGLVAVCGAGALILVGIVLAVAGVFGGGGGKTVNYPAEARGVMNKFQGFMSAKSLSGLQGLMTKDAQYHYLGDSADSTTKEYGLLFKDLDVTDYSLKVGSVDSTPNGAVTVNATYSYNDGKTTPPAPLQGSIQLKMKPSGPSGALKITDVYPTPDLLEQVDVVGAPVFVTCIARLGGAGGPVIAKQTGSFRSDGKSQSMFLPLSASGVATLRAADSMNAVCSGHDKNGPFNFTDKALKAPFAS